jgi:hypothetical protein
LPGATARGLAHTVHAALSRRAAADGTATSGAQAHIGVRTACAADLCEERVALEAAHTASTGAGCVRDLRAVGRRAAVRGRDALVVAPLEARDAIEAAHTANTGRRRVGHARTGHVAGTAVVYVGVLVNTLPDLRSGTAGAQIRQSSRTLAPLAGGAARVLRAAAATADQKVRAAEPVGARGCVGEAGVAFAAFLGSTAFTLTSAGAARKCLGLAALAGDPAHARDGGQRATKQRAGEQAQRPAPRHAGAGQSFGQLVEGAFPRGTPRIGGDLSVPVFG